MTRMIPTAVSQAIVLDRSIQHLVDQCIQCVVLKMVFFSLLSLIFCLPNKFGGRWPFPFANDDGLFRLQIGAGAFMY